MNLEKFKECLAGVEREKDMEEVRIRDAMQLKKAFEVEPTKKQKQIEIEMDKLAKTIIEIREEVVCLEENLTPILLATPDEALGHECDNTLCDMAKVITIFQGDLKNILCKIRSIIQRIQI